MLRVTSARIRKAGPGRLTDICTMASRCDTDTDTSTYTHTLADQSSRGMLFVLGLLVLVFLNCTSVGLELYNMSRYVDWVSPIHITTNWKGLRWAVPSRMSTAPLLI